MTHPTPDNPPIPSRLTWRWLALAVLLYVASLAVATHPALWTFASRLPSLGADHMQHLWVLRWYADCVRHLRWPGHAPGIQYPIGAPLGLFSPLQFQALLYVPLSWCTDNDVLCYNLIWLFNLVFTGLGSLVFIWTVVGDRVSALVGGLLVMLSGPVLMHAHGHLELITLGWMPLFLAAWMRWLDQPSGRRLLGVVVLYVLVTLSAAYYAVLIIMPAALYVVYQALQHRAHLRQWLRSRALWFLAFTGAVLPCLVVLFLPHVEARVQGYTLPRTRAEFEFYGAPIWAYIVPGGIQGIGRLLGHDYYLAPGLRETEMCSYGGVVMLGLLMLAAVRRVELRRRGYWWCALAFMVILSLGACWQVAGMRISLPADWLWVIFHPFRLIRCPCRFNLLAMIIAAVLAAAGLRHWLSRWSKPKRVLALVVIWIVSLTDLSMGAFQAQEVPACPLGYQAMLQKRPRAVFLEVPQYNSWAVQWFNALCAYWQSHHHGFTTAGYSGMANLSYDQQMVVPSPFNIQRLGDEKYLDQPDALSIDMVQNIRFLDYVWLYTQAHHIDYLVLHTAPEALPCFHPATLERLRAQLRTAKVYEGKDIAFYDCRLLPRPANGVLLTQKGWQQLLTWQGPPVRAAARQARVIAYSPAAQASLRFSFTAAGLGQARTVHLQCDGQQLAQWRVTAGQSRTYHSPEFPLGAGLHELVLESDGQTSPCTAEDIGYGDRRPYSLRVAGLELHEAGWRADAGFSSQEHEDPSR